MPAAAAVAVGVGSAALSARAQRKAGKQAAGAQKDAARQASETELEMFYASQEERAPWREAGRAGLAQLQYLYGMQPSASFYAGNQSTGKALQKPKKPAYLDEKIGVAGKYNARLNKKARKDYLKQLKAYRRQQNIAEQRQSEAFETAQDSGLFGVMTPGGYYDYLTDFDYEATPGYQKELDERMEVASRAASARGLNMSGPMLERLQEITSGQRREYMGMREQGLLNYLGGLQSMAGIGRQTVEAGAAQGANVAASIGGNIRGAGAAQAQSYISSGAAKSNMWDQLGEIGGFAAGGGFGSGGTNYVNQPALTNAVMSTQMPMFGGYEY